MAVLFAALAALSYGAASVLQAVGARRTHVAGHGIARVLQQRTYLAGLLADAAGWGMSLLALRSLPLFEVQAIVASSVGVTAALSAVTTHHHLGRRELAALLAVLASLIVIGLAAGSEGLVRVHHGARWTLIAGVPVSVGATFLAMRYARPVVMGALSGVIFSGSALSARLVHVPHTWWHIVLQPLAWCVPAYGLTAMSLYAKALSRANVGTVTAAMWVTNVIAPSIIGVVFLHDKVRAGWAVPTIIAMSIAIVATVVLASVSPAQATRSPSAPATST